MINLIGLSWQYLRYYQGRSALLLCVLTLILCLPISASLIVDRFEQRAIARAVATPLIIGAKGSRFGLVMHSLYFRGEAPGVIRVAEQIRVDDFRLVETIPLFVKFKARGVPIAGTDKRYLDFRRLVISKGSGWERLGDCLLGAAVARQLALEPGDRLLSDPHNMFDLAGPVPLNMRVVGVLAPSGTADDDVIWCDIKSTWIMEGIGHGHAVASNQNGSDHLHSASGSNLQVQQEVTEENLSTFHFHGRRRDYPLTSILAISADDRSETLLIGKYLDSEETHQVVRPVEAVAELMDAVSRVKGLFEIGLGLLSLATFALLVLVLVLSLRLRQPEIQTMHLLGCGRGSVFLMVAGEWIFLFLTSLVCAILMASCLVILFDTLILRMISVG